MSFIPHLFYPLTGVGLKILLVQLSVLCISKFMIRSIPCEALHVTTASNFLYYSFCYLHLWHLSGNEERMKEACYLQPGCNLQFIFDRCMLHSIMIYVTKGASKIHSCRRSLSVISIRLFHKDFHICNSSVLETEL